MTCFEKSPLRFKTETLLKKYDTFALAEPQEKNGVLSFDFSQNCDLSNGDVRVGVGVESITLANGRGVIYDWSLSAPTAFFYCGEKFSFLSDENKLYHYDESARKFQLAHAFGGAMKAIEAQDKNGVFHLYFCGKDGVFSYDVKNGVVRVLESACVPVACACQGRIFTASTNAIVYSAPFSTADFEESIDGAGKIVLPAETGEILDLVASGDAVFAFCQYGIWKLTVSGSARDFRLEQTAFSCKDVIKGSACVGNGVSGEKVFFFTQHGVYKLDKTGVERVCKNLTFDMKRVGQVCEHAYLDGKVIYNYRAKDNSVRNVVIDVETEKGYHAFTAEGVSNLRGKAVAVIDSIVYVIEPDFSLPTHRLAELVAECCDFRVAGMKTLKKLRVFGDKQITLTVSNGRRSKTFILQMQNGVAEADVKMRGEDFRLKFVLGNGARLDGLHAEVCRLIGVAK